MAGPIARRPAGLLDLLLTQQQGKNPEVLGNDVQPVMDLTKFYGQERLESSNKALTATAINSLVTHTVPAGESWLLLCAAVRGAFAAAGQEIGLELRISGFKGAAFLACDALAFAQSIAATDAFGDGFDIPAGGVIYPSGVSFTFLTQKIALAAQPNIAVTTNLLFIRMNT